MLDIPVLTILYPPEQRRVIPIPEGKSVVGRGIDADIRLDDTLVSRKHCEITRNGKSIRLKDMNSTNGTFVNCNDIGDIELQPNAELELGTTILKFEWKDSSDDTDPAPSTLLKQEAFYSYAKSIAIFSARNNLPLAALYLKCEADEFIAKHLESQLVKIIAKEKRANDLFTVSEYKNGHLEFLLMLPHLSREDAIEETCAIRDAIEKRHFYLNETAIDIKPKFGFAYVPEATTDICDTLFANARELASN